MSSSGLRIEDSALRDALVGVEPKQANSGGAHGSKWLDPIAAPFEVILP